MLKICSRCKNEKGLKEFSKDKKRPDGLYVYCKACVKESSRKRYLNNKEAILKKTKKWKENNKEYYLKQQREYSKKYQKSLPGKFREYKYAAESRNYPFEINRKDFDKFWQKPCNYCGKEIETIGIDRVDNNKGYTLDNIVSCCSICNRAKDTMSAEEYIEHCKSVAANN